MKSSALDIGYQESALEYLAAATTRTARTAHATAHSAQTVAEGHRAEGIKFLRNFIRLYSISGHRVRFDRAVHLRFLRIFVCSNYTTGYTTTWPTWVPPPSALSSAPLSPGNTIMA
jgi:hypothetical protein